MCRHAWGSSHESSCVGQFSCVVMHGEVLMCRHAWGSSHVSSCMGQFSCVVMHGAVLMCRHARGSSHVLSCVGQFSCVVMHGAVLMCRHAWGSSRRESAEFCLNGVSFAINSNATSRDWLCNQRRCKVGTVCRANLGFRAPCNDLSSSYVQRVIQVFAWRHSPRPGGYLNSNEGRSLPMLVMSAIITTPLGLYGKMERCCASVYLASPHHSILARFVTAWFMQRDGKEVFTEQIIFCAVVFPLLLVYSSYSYTAYKGDMRFWNLILSRTCADSDIITSLL
jgi:hypothetical protein